LSARYSTTVPLSAVRQDATDSHLAPDALSRGTNQLTLRFVPCFLAPADAVRRSADLSTSSFRHHRMMMVTSATAVIETVQRLSVPKPTEQQTSNDHRHQ
jgi:hypothetical protein